VLLPSPSLGPQVRLGGEALQVLELLPVAPYPLPANVGERDAGVWLLTDERLVDGDQARAFQLGEVAGEVPVGQSQRALQEHEVGVFR
jgi:hypothetical protein